MLKKIGLTVLALIAAFLGYVAAQSPDYEVSRQIAIQAPAEKVFPYLNNQKLAEQWGPWLEVDPKARMSYSGPDAGVGAKGSWTGGEKLGTGSATITESEPLKRVGIQLEYTEPQPMSQFSEYLLEQRDGQSVVTWRVRGKNGFVGRIFCSFFDMDKRVGEMFEKGLAKLKAVAEKAG